MSPTTFRRLGGIAWLVIVAAGAVVIARLPTGSAHNAAEAISVSLWRSATTFKAVDVRGDLRAGDSVFAKQFATQSSRDGEVSWRQVGHVVSADPQHLTIAWYDKTAPQSHRFRAHRQSGSLSEVVATLLPPEKRQRIRTRIEALMNEQGKEIADSLAPLVRQSLERSLPIIETEFRASIKRHRGEIDELTQTWNNQIVQQRLIPLSRTEILPIVRVHWQPEMEAIGRELWDKASLWRFGWRAIYDKSPLPRHDLLREEWDRFVKEEAIPVIESHTDDLVLSLQKTLRDIATNPRVQDELRDVAIHVANDPKAQEILQQVLRETLIESPALRDAWKEVWTSREAQASLQRTGDRLEPVIREIGDDLFGSHETGIDANFARVLRSQILGKDRRWIEAVPAGVPATPSPTLIKVLPATESMVYPIVSLVERR